MAFQTSVQDRRPSPPQLALNLASNNPFRRAVSPQPPSYNSLSPRSPAEELDERRASTNPFLDTYKRQSPSKPGRPEPARTYSGGPQPRVDPTGAGRATDLLADLTLNNKPPPRDPPRRPPPPPGVSHRQTHSQDEERPGQPRKADPFNVFASPSRPSNENHRPRPRVRRNSESSMMELKDDERRRRERRPGDRERPERREGRDKDSSRPRQSRKTRPAKGLDLIDKLDITGIYGQGSFHHDGPFDACNPHRNKKGSRAAPMQAFPEGSKNNALGGAGPVNKQLDYDLYHGRMPDVFTDYNSHITVVPPRQLPPRPGDRDTRPLPKEKLTSWDAKEKVEQLHGEETVGLGTSTFFEGTAAPRAALQRRASENDDTSGANGGGLQRKRSIAQKIRGMRGPRPTYPDGTVVRSPDRFPGSPGSQGNEAPLSAGGRARATDNNTNPYFADVNSNEKKANAQVTVAAAGSSSGANGSGATRTRTNTNGSMGQSPPPPQQPRDSDEWGLGERETGRANGGSGSGSGILGRVKSLRGKKTRPERFGTA